MAIPQGARCRRAPGPKGEAPAVATPSVSGRPGASRGPPVLTPGRTARSSTVGGKARQAAARCATSAAAAPSSAPTVPTRCQAVATTARAPSRRTVSSPRATSKRSCTAAANGAAGRRAGGGVGATSRDGMASDGAGRAASRGPTIAPVAPARSSSRGGRTLTPGGR